MITNDGFTNGNIFETTESFKAAFDAVITKEKKENKQHFSQLKEDVSFESSQLKFQGWRFNSYTRYGTDVYREIEIVRKAVYDALKRQESKVAVPYLYFDDTIVARHITFLGNEETKGECITHYQLEGRVQKVLWEGKRLWEVGLDATLYKTIVEPTLRQLLESCGIEMSQATEVRFPVVERNTYLEEQRVATVSLTSFQRTAVKDIPQITLHWDPVSVPNYPLPDPISVATPQGLNQLFQEAYSTGKKCDVEISFASGVLKVHSLVLAITSEPLEKLVDSEMKEKAEKKVKLNYLSYQTGKAIFDHIYFGTNPFSTPGGEQVNGVDILRCALMWNLPFLKDYAANELGQRVIESDYEQLGKLGVLYESSYLLAVYNCYRLRRKEPLPDDIKGAMEKLNISK